MGGVSKLLLAMLASIFPLPSLQLSTPDEISQEKFRGQPDT